MTSAASPLSVTQRLATVGRLSGLRVDDATPLVSHSNDAWMIGSVVLRVCWRGDRDRLAREALLLTNLPDAIPHVEVIDYGEGEGLTWMVTRRVEGEVLYDVWPDLRAAERRAAISEVAAALELLHRWPVASEVRSVFSEHENRQRTDAAEVVSSFLVPLPVACLAPLVESAHAQRLISEPLADAVLSCVRTLEPCDPFTTDEAPVVVHGDVHLRNVLWHDGHVVALLDFEWARLGPRDLELECFVRYHNTDSGDQIQWLRAAYPRLFAHASLVDRVRLYEIACLVRQLHVWQDAEDVAHLRRAAAGADRITALLRGHAGVGAR